MKAQELDAPGPYPQHRPRPVRKGLIRFMVFWFKTLNP